MSAAMPLPAESSAHPLYLPTAGRTFGHLNLGFGSFTPAGMFWTTWSQTFFAVDKAPARLGMISESLRRIRWQDRAEALTWYLQVANGHDHGLLSGMPRSYTQLARRAAFDEICRAIAFSQFEPRPDCRIRLHFIDSQDAIAAFMWFINREACGHDNLPADECWQRTALDEFINGFALLHWADIDAMNEDPYPKNSKSLSSWLVANRPCLLRYLYRHKMLEFVRLPDDQLTPDDVDVLRTCVFEDSFNAPPGKSRAKNLQQVRENGDRNAWEAVRLITRAEVRHRAAERPSRPSRRRNHRLR